MKKKYNQLTQEDRLSIYIYLQEDFSYSEIAKRIGKSKSTISREIERNTGFRGYRWKQAHSYACIRRNSIPKKIRLTKPILSIIKAKLKIRWSPEQISNWLLCSEGISISHETIYKMIRIDKQLGGMLFQYLRQGSRKRRKSYGTGKTQKGSIKNRISIEKRPKIVESQIRIGDFEGDTIVGKNHKGSLVTLVDRKSLYLKMYLLPDRTAHSVTNAVCKVLKNVKKHLHTITFDNGKEFAFHEDISKKLETKIFFANPYSFWQRAINENLNGLIRQYFPKKTDFSKLTQKDVERVENELNNRPRKKLGFKTPNEVFWNLAS